MKRELFNIQEGVFHVPLPSWGSLFWGYNCLIKNLSHLPFHDTDHDYAAKTSYSDKHKNENHGGVGDGLGFLQVVYTVLRDWPHSGVSGRSWVKVSEKGGIQGGTLRFWLKVSSTWGCDWIRGGSSQSLLPELAEWSRAGSEPLRIRKCVRLGTCWGEVRVCQYWHWEKYTD